jgi:small subunit ribosomal protein S6
LAELERNIRITDGLFKFVTVRLDDAPAAPSTEEA